MVYSQDSVTGDPEVRLTYQELFRRVRRNQADISSLLDAVEFAQRLFLSRSDIYWQQCEHIAGTLRLVLVPIRELLEAMTRLPGDLELHRAPLVIALHKVINAVEDLAPIIAQYSFADQGSPHPTVVRRWDIQCKFDQLIDGCHDVLRQSIRLLDTARLLAAL